ncbi:MAG: DUF3141 domain-containing protein [Alphaproteobacteria bacterium]|nr:DUF3141 domain-containing protein [Alphaproteobacteria bacterium]
MTNVFDLFGPKHDEILNSLTDSTAWSPSERLKAFTGQFGVFSSMNEMILRGASKHLENIAETHNARTQRSLDALTKAAETFTARQAAGSLMDDWRAYAEDSGQRTLMTLDTLRERGDIFLEHEAAGCPPVLVYDYELIVDGAELSRPCNYQLLRIVPPKGVEVEDWKRPYVIIDPRAGHGPGIGGFKEDSQVGVALRDGHPVYFVSFTKDPVPGQTLADVTRAEAEFVREVMRRHPKSSKPVVLGNCQGGWATLLLAATNPDLTGPIVLNGAPVAPWSGLVGTHPMRYNGGMLGGTWQTMFWSDLGHGIFDGAHLVMNFEMLNPSRSFFRKYYDLYSKADTERARFLEFETWWGGFFLMNEAEIRWIVENLFIGNRLTKNEARLEPGRVVDVKNIRSPIIVFASHGDNITPPAQALNWIVDAFADASEIRIRGQRIIYMVHDQVGHLGIFVSSKIAKKEHVEVTSTMKTIEALPPGLYEMKIDDYEGDVLNRTFTVSFHDRTLQDLRNLDPDRGDEAAFAAVARTSEQQAELYDVGVRPFVQAAVTPVSAEASRTMHPLRLQRALFSSRVPALGSLAGLAEKARAERRPVESDNPFVQAEKIWADLIEQSMDMFRDVRDAWYETAFFSIWGTPWMHWFGRTHQPGRMLRNQAELMALPNVQSALMRIEEGGFVEAVIRMLVLLAESRGNVRRDRLERSSRVMTQDEPFSSLSADERAMIIYEQTLIVQFARDQSIEALPKLLKTEEERALAAQVVQYIPGAIDEMAPHTFEMLQRFHELLGLPPVTQDITEDPLADAKKTKKIVKPAAAA